MSSNVLEFDSVTKRYSAYGGILSLRNFVYRLKNAQFRNNLVRQEDFVALDNVGFTIKAGEKVGIIGPNGAGKTTVLKLVQGVVFPSSGTIRITGKVGGLIEMGTGFQENLTGRENVYLYGAIQGLRKKQITALFDQIVDIAEIGPFIDVPLKRYSSGMKVRLCFAVALTSVPDVILLDEVLAVGDAKFQRKSMSLMQEYLAGKTILFVSHAMDQVLKVCDRVIVLNRGRIEFDGDPESAVKVYKLLNENKNWKDETLLVPQNLQRGFPEIPKVTVKDVVFHDCEDSQSPSFRRGRRITFDISFNLKTDESPNLKVRVSLTKLMMERFTGLIGGCAFEGVVDHQNVLSGSFETSFLSSGDYVLEIVPEIVGQSSKTAIPIHRTKFKIIAENEEHTGVVDLGFSFDLLKSHGNAKEERFLSGQSSSPAGSM